MTSPPIPPFPASSIAAALSGFLLAQAEKPAGMTRLRLAVSILREPLVVRRVVALRAEPLSAETRAMLEAGAQYLDGVLGVAKAREKARAKDNLKSK